MSSPVATPVRDQSRLIRYGVAIGVTGLSLLVRWPLWRILGSQAPHMTFFPAVMISAYFGGFGPGLLATFLSAFAAHYFLGDARFQIDTAQGAVSLTLFLMVGTVISGLTESLHRMRRRVVADEGLRESEERWRSLTDALPQLVWSAGPDGACDYFSTQWTQHTGVPEADLLGWQWLKVLHSDDREPTRKFWTDSVAGRGPYDVEYRIRRSDGEYRWFKTRGVPIRDSEGHIFKWFGTCTDITASKEFEEELRRVNARLDLAVRGSNIGIFEVDLQDGKYIGGRAHFINVWEQLGHQPTENSVEATADSTAWMTSLHPDDRDRVLSEIQAQLSGPANDYHVAYRARHRDGSDRWMLARGTITRDESGKAIRVTGSRVDVSDLKQIEHELRQAKEAAEAANHAKDEFLANVSHEIRTPMNAIFGMTDLALDTSLTNDQRQILKTVKSAADNLLGLINDLLDFSKIEAGKLELDISEFSLLAALCDTLRVFKARSKEKGLDFSYDVGPDVPDSLLGDSGRLRQVLLNLVGNAVKFTDAGAVTVRVEVADVAQEGNIVLRFTVTDTGIGIPPDKQQRIFRAFEQEDTSTTRKYGGTGLGLTIAARLVDLMGGVISVESQPGRGSRFAFTARFELAPEADKTLALPQQQADAPLPEQPPRQAEPLRVLVAEDNDFNAQLIEQLLIRRGHHVSLAPDGQSALALLCDSQFDLLILDIHMPELDGFEVTGAIRRREQSVGGHLPIIALTARSRSEDRDKCLAAGMDEFLTKPFRADDLWIVIDRVIGHSRPVNPSNGEPSQSQAAFDCRTILAACGGDESLLRKMCQSFEERIPAHLAALEEALGGQDAPRVRETAHKLCGMIATFSADAGEIAAKLEERAAHGDLAACGPLGKRLAAMTSGLIGSVSGLSVARLRASTEVAPNTQPHLVGQTIGPVG
ncbi:MAG TPA: PAS domain-containing protein [Planctomycetaceae bacterium]|jgi:PAS domain S-box-containing protein|nr:PAS domain-containing protein [Planctomycetaceae bacterium]